MALFKSNRRSDIFKSELIFIDSQEIKEFTESLINKLPDYFFEVAASSTGKYHPTYTLGQGGLVRHTKAAARIAIELFNLDTFKPLYANKDHVIAALLLHDGLKHGLSESKYTVTEHPKLMEKFILEFSCGPIEEDGKLIASLVSTHMGQWVNDFQGIQVLQRPTTKLQHLVHICDYLASRKCITVNTEAI